MFFAKGKAIAIKANPLCFINSRLEEKDKDSLTDFTLDYFLSILVDNRRIIKSTKGTPIKTTQGTNVSVSNKVF